MKFVFLPYMIISTHYVMYDFHKIKKQKKAYKLFDYFYSKHLHPDHMINSPQINHVKISN